MATFNERVKNWMNIAIGDKKLDLEEISERDFVCILLDLILYEDTYLVSNAFQLLVRFFSQNRALFQIANEVQLLQDKNAIVLFKKTSKILLRMKKHAENAEFWLGFNDPANLDKAKAYMEDLAFLSELCMNKDKEVMASRDSEGSFLDQDRSSQQHENEN